MCGNASRCIGKYVYEHGLTQHTEITLETLSGIKTLHLHVAEGKVNTVTVDMEQPLLENKQQLATASGSMMDGEIKADGQTFKGTFVCMGIRISSSSCPMSCRFLSPKSVRNWNIIPSFRNAATLSSLKSVKMEVSVCEFGNGAPASPWPAVQVPVLLP